MLLAVGGCAFWFLDLVFDLFSGYLVVRFDVVWFAGCLRYVYCLLIGLIRVVLLCVFLVCLSLRFWCGGFVVGVIRFYWFGFCLVLLC